MLGPGVAASAPIATAARNDCGHSGAKCGHQRLPIFKTIPEETVSHRKSTHHNQITDIDGTRRDAVSDHLVGDNVRPSIAVNVSGSAAVGERVSDVAELIAASAIQLGDPNLRAIRRACQIDDLGPATSLPEQRVQRARVGSPKRIVVRRTQREVIDAITIKVTVHARVGGDGARYGTVNRGRDQLWRPSVHRDVHVAKRRSAVDHVS